MSAAGFMEEAINKELSIKSKFDEAALKIRKSINKDTNEINFVIPKHYSSPKKFAKKLIRCEQRDNRGM